MGENESLIPRPNFFSFFFLWVTIDLVTADNCKLTLAAFMPSI